MELPSASLPHVGELEDEGEVVRLATTTPEPPVGPLFIATAVAQPPLLTGGGGDDTSAGKQTDSDVFYICVFLWRNKNTKENHIFCYNWIWFRPTPA